MRNKNFNPNARLSALLFVFGWLLLVALLGLL